MPRAPGVGARRHDEAHADRDLGEAALPSMRSSFPSTSAESSRHSKREAFAIARKVIIVQSPRAASSSVSGAQ